MAHDEDHLMTTDTSEDPAQPVHCCACWQNTDQSNSLNYLMHSAVSVLSNGNILDVAQGEAFKAADAFLACVFRENTTPSLSMPKF